MRGAEVRGGREKAVAARRSLSDHLWNDRGDRLWKALQTVNHGNENVADAPGPQFIHYPQPVFGAFGGFDPQAQNGLRSIRRNAERDIDGLVAHQPLVADFDA